MNLSTTANWGQASHAKRCISQHLHLHPAVMMWMYFTILAGPDSTVVEDGCDLKAFKGVWLGGDVYWMCRAY